MFVIQSPVDFVVVARAKIDHDVLVAVKEHDSARVIEFIPKRKKRMDGGRNQTFLCTSSLHRVEVGHFGDVDEVDDAKVLHVFSQGVENFIHRHTCLVPVMPKPDSDDFIFFREDGLVHCPTRVKVRKHIRHFVFLDEFSRWQRKLDEEEVLIK